MTADRFDPHRASRLSADGQGDAVFPSVPEQNFHVRRMTLIALLVAAVVLPCLYVAAMAFNDMRSREADATDMTLRTVRIAEEHALKVFDMNETLDTRIVDLTEGLDDAGIRAREAAIHHKVRTMGGGYPQVAAVSIFGRDGTLLVSSRFYPAPPVSIGDREDFVGLREGRDLEHVSKVMSGHVAGEQVFNSGIERRAPDGTFAGVVSVALRPSYFDAFYRELLGGNDGVPMSMSLVRADGAVLAHYPRRPGEPTAVAADSPFAEAMKEGRRAGVTRMRSNIDGDNMIVAFRHVGSYPVYVMCGYRASAMWAAWYRHLAVLILSIFTPSVALWCVIWLSLRRLGAEEEAWERWQAEASMRRSIESAYRQSRKMEALGTLVGSVAHDFNNLLMILSANVQIARRRGASGLDRELSAMERALKSGQSLTRQLLGVARKQPLRNETVALDRWLPACRDLLRASLGAKVSLVIDIGVGIWPMRVDVAELELALINIAVNARDAMPNGGRFTVRATNITFRHEDGFPLTGDFVQVSLEDTGVGMAPEVLARAFEPLFTTKAKGMGTGLGLPQVFAFCERSGGLAAIDSAVGAGTSVRLYLPRATEEPIADGPAETGTEDPGASHGLRVLLVEDNEEVAAGTEALLQMMGHHVTCVLNADMALSLLEQARAQHTRSGEPLPFDVVLSDIHMPGALNGIDLAEAIRAFDIKLPVILVTGYAEELDRARQVNVRVLSKPFDIALLESLLQGIQRELAHGGLDPATHQAL
ncbi:hybrid sensor histidine kinase/response regulator [Paraburkholderia phenoliruptrix]|uniref:hybrid sensor histidine kinase/response regulator n=1 Tax=Paraburkholderia phenoliruptrix TaxID=252970 RepID=UPI001C6E907C|nr:hybrid sensor histidine kinase/response regulator [Paraburkholderia phenoliruptrix]MBW9106238.1 response regulator [Paraburkholderia phenoliruptrix]MBW9129311.1 response regulator [Paraburkholderia ginsengiterrae]